MRRFSYLSSSLIFFFFPYLVGSQIRARRAISSTNGELAFQFGANQSVRFRIGKMFESENRLGFLIVSDNSLYRQRLIRGGKSCVASHSDSGFSNCLGRSSCFGPNLALTLWKVGLALLACQKNWILSTACIVTTGMRHGLSVFQLLNIALRVPIICSHFGFNLLSRVGFSGSRCWDGIGVWYGNQCSEESTQPAGGCCPWKGLLVRWPVGSHLWTRISGGSAPFLKLGVAHLVWTAFINSVFYIEHLVSFWNFGTCQAERCLSASSRRKALGTESLMSFPGRQHFGGVVNSWPKEFGTPGVPLLEEDPGSLFLVSPANPPALSSGWFLFISFCCIRSHEDNCVWSPVSLRESSNLRVVVGFCHHNQITCAGQGSPRSKCQRVWCHLLVFRWLSPPCILFFSRKNSGSRYLLIRTLITSPRPHLLKPLR